jgi:probable F420-dependent oxidoreductase
VRIGVFGVGVGAMADPGAGPVARLAEELGYSSLWTGEHMVVPRDRPDYFPRAHTWAFADPVVHLAFLAAHTTSIGLGTGVLILPQRHPVQLAKELATLDVLSRGRLVAGLGVGHLQVELRAIGVPARGRGERAEEYLSAMRALWSMPAPEFHGRYVDFAGVDAYPRPVRPHGPPLVLGGSSRAALERAARHGDGWYGWGLDPEQTRLAIRTIRQAAEAAHRDLTGFSAYVTPLVRMDEPTALAYAEAGVDELVLSMESDNLDSVRRKLERSAGFAALVKA